MRTLKTAIAVAAVLIPTLAFGLEAPEGYTHVFTKAEQFEFEGEKVDIPFDIWVKPRFEEGAAFFDLWADVDLTAMQEHAPAVMAGSNSHDACGDRVQVSNVTLEPTAPRAELCARVNYQKWQCVYAMLPVMSGFTVTLKKTLTAKTKLVDQTARMCADLWPEVEDEGAAVRLQGRVTSTSVSGNSGLLGILVDVRGQFRSRLRSEVNSALSDLKLLMPEALQPFDPVVETAEFTERDDGTLGLVMTLAVSVTPEDVATILQMLLAGESED